MQPNGGRWWQATGLGLILLTGAGLVAWAEQNDSGQNQCYDGHDMVACTEATSGDQAPHPRQDGRYGRDAQGEHLTKTGGGLAGFDFTPLDAQGQPIPLLEGVPVTPPACTRDNLTGLTWEIKTQDRGLRDQDWTYADQQTPGDPCGASLGAQGCDPAAYGAAVNAQGLCGAQDWRLPSVTELRSLVDASGFDPALDAAYFPHSPSGPYRTATPGPGPGQSWVVHFRDGQASPAPNDQPQHLRLVRGPGAPPSSHSSTGDGTISQTPSGLIWAPCSEGQSLPGCLGQARPMTWAQALLTARGAQLAGYRDWRLPSRVELATLVDRDRQGPAIDGAHFPNTPPARYWTSTSLMADPSQAWSIDFQDGADQAQDKQSLGYLRLVRAGTVDGLAMTDTQDPAGDVPSAPAARTGSPSVVTAANAWITGTVDDRGSITQVRFEYGPTDRYGATITANPNSLGAGSGATAVNATLSGLSCGTLYNYRVKAENAAGTRTGEDQRFTTALCGAAGGTEDRIGSAANLADSAPREASSCGNNWLSVTPSPTINHLYSVVYDGAQFVAVGSTGTILTSLDGAIWTAQVSGTTNALFGVTWSGSQFVAVGARDTILTSPEGTVWTAQVSGMNERNFYGVTWTGNLFVVAGGGPLLISADGVNWSNQNYGSASITFQGVAHGGGSGNVGTVVVGFDGNIMTSPGGDNWTSRDSGTTNDLYSVIRSGTQFVAVGSAGTILTSPTGSGWTAQASGTTNYLKAVTRSGTQFVAVGSAGTILTSPTGSDWTEQASGTTNVLNGATWSGSQFLAVGNYGTILTSVCVAAPTATTSAASTITATGATLNGTVNANGADATTSFDYGPTISYGSNLAATPGSIGGSVGSMAIAANLTGLTCNTTYHYRVTATNSIGTSQGLDETFTTGVCAPTATSSAASTITATGATLNGTVNANGADATVSFDYGPTISYGSNLAATPATVGAAAGSTSISASLTGLTCNSTHHYRARGLNSAGTGLGGDQTFTTGACAPTAATNTASAITATSATLNGTVNDNGAVTTVSFEWGTTTAYGNSLNASPGSVAAGAGSTSVSGVLSGLAFNRTYHYRVKAQNSGGISYGGDQTVTPNATLTTALGGSGQGRVTSDPAGIDCGSDCTVTYPGATLVTLTAVPETGSTFTGWSGACGGTASTCFVNLAGNMTATAVFEPAGSSTCGVDWQWANPLPQGNGLSAVAYGSNVFVAVGGAGTILTSPDGETWTGRTSGTNGYLYGVTWSGSQFVAVGDSGTILTSPDGLNWTARVSGTIAGLRDVKGNESQLVAVGTFGTILTSADGGTWTARVSGTGQDLLGVSWSADQFLAVGLNGTILASPDGWNWTSRTSGTTNSLLGVTWSGSQFVAVGSHGTILTSPDGVTWTLRTSGTTDYLRGVTWSGSQFVVVGDFGTILTSPDGLTWTSRSSGTTDELYGVAWGGGQFVAVGYRGTILTSPDGVTWIARVSGTTNRLWGVTWSGTQFVAVGSSGTILTSPDGVTWIARASGTANTLYGVTWSGAQFVAVGDLGTILTSSDGAIWTARSSGMTQYIREVIWGGSQFVAVGIWGTILTSPDGVSWTTHLSGAQVLNGVTFSGSLFVAVDEAGKILSSPDGVTWTVRTSGTTTALYGVAWGGSQFVAVGFDGTLLTSPDGTTWTARNSGTINRLQSVTWGGNQFIAVGYYGGTILTSACTAAPTATTGAASAVTATGATLNGTVNPNGADATVGFDYGLTTAYGSSMAATPATVGASAGATGVSASLTGLDCNTTYHYRVTASNSAGTSQGLDESFTTAACPATAPTATTSAATHVMETAATLNGTLNPNGADTTASFDYGPTISYGNSVGATPGSIGGIAGITAIAASLTGLTCNNTYHYRATGLNSAGTGLGEDQTFTTAACPVTAPTATTSAATSVTATTATLNGAITPNGATTTASFDYGPTTSYGGNLSATPGSIGGSAGSTAVSASLTGLTCNTTYHYQVMGLNSAGTGLGGDQSFTTGACPTLCTTGAILVNTPTTISGPYSLASEQSITTSASVQVQTGADVTFAAPSIRLGPGFRVALGAKFRAEAHAVTCP